MSWPRGHLGCWLWKAERVGHPDGLSDGWWKSRQKISTEVDQTKLAAASQHISTWAQKNCRA